MNRHINESVKSVMEEDFPQIQVSGKERRRIFQQMSDIKKDQANKEKNAREKLKQAFGKAVGMFGKGINVNGARFKVEVDDYGYIRIEVDGKYVDEVIELFQNATS